MTKIFERDDRGRSNFDAPKRSKTGGKSLNCQNELCPSQGLAHRSITSDMLIGAPRSEEPDGARTKVRITYRVCDYCYDIIKSNPYLPRAVRPSKTSTPTLPIMPTVRKKVET